MQYLQTNYLKHAICILQSCITVCMLILVPCRHAEVYHISAEYYIERYTYVEKQTTKPYNVRQPQSQDNIRLYVLRV